MGGERGRQVLQVGREEMMRNVQIIEPEEGQRGQQPAFVGDAGGQHPVERAEAVGGHQNQPITQVVDVAHLAATTGKTQDMTFQEWLHDILVTRASDTLPGRRATPVQAARSARSSPSTPVFFNSLSWFRLPGEDRQRRIYWREKRISA